MTSYGRSNCWLYFKISWGIGLVIIAKGLSEIQYYCLTGSLFGFNLWTTMDIWGRLIKTCHHALKAWRRLIAADRNANFCRNLTLNTCTRPVPVSLHHQYYLSWRESKTLIMFLKKWFDKWTKTTLRWRLLIVQVWVTKVLLSEAQH